VLLVGLLIGATARADPSDDFVAAWLVLSHPRCTNCHAGGRGPTVGEDRQPHPFSVRRGKDGRGVTGVMCEGCHETANAPGRQTPPGAPDWRMPIDVARLVFSGTKPGDLCRLLAPRAKQMAKLLADDPLHAWPWTPGEGRMFPWIGREAFLFAVTRWRDAGAHCPP
jgi:hypothetical protein